MQEVQAGPKKSRQVNERHLVSMQQDLKKLVGFEPYAHRVKKLNEDSLLNTGPLT